MLRKTAFACLLLLSVFASICLGLRLNGAPERETDLGRVSIAFQPSLEGRIEVYTPLTDWGVTAHAFSSPATVRIEPRALDRPALMKMARQPTPILRSTEKDLKDAVLWSAVKAAGWILLMGLLFIWPVLLLARRWKLSNRWALVPPLGSIGISGIVALAALLSFNPNSFNDPTYWAKGSELPQLINFAHHAHKSSNSYESSVSRGIRELAGVLSGAPAGVKSSDSMVLMSDLHNNMLALKSVRELIDHHPVFFVGDFAHEGTSVEQQLLLPALQGLGHPLMGVSGNHDSTQLMKKIAKDGGIVMGQDGQLTRGGTWTGIPVYQFGKLRVMGFADPLEAKNPDSSNRNFSLTEEQKATIADNWAQLVRQAHPNVVLVHQSGIADLLARKLHDQHLLILTGHDHTQHVERYDHVLVVDAGSVGAGGILGAGRQYVGLAKLYFTGSDLQAIDMVRLEPIRGSGESQRIVFDEQCRMVDKLRCEYLIQNSPDHR